MYKSMRRGFLAAGALLVAALVVAGCSTGGSTTNSSEQGPVKVGALLSIKGIYAAVGVPERDALQLAFDEINQSGGILGRQIKVTVYDDEGDQTKAQQLANRFVQEDKVAAVFGPGITAMASVACPVFEQNKVLNINFTAQRSIWEGKSYIWSSVPEDSLMAESMAKYAADKLKAKKVVILYSNVQYGVHGNDLLKEAIPKYQLQIAADEKWGEGNFDFTSVIGRIKTANPDAILLWGSGSPSDAQIVKQLRDQGITVTLIGNTAYVGKQLVEVAGKAAERFTAVSLMNWAAPDKTTQNFVQNYQQKYNKPPTAQSAYAYDAAYRYKAAVEKAKSFDPAKVAAAMQGLQFQSIQGSFSITAQNHVGASSAEAYHPLVVKEGKWTLP